VGLWMELSRGGVERLAMLRDYFVLDSRVSERGCKGQVLLGSGDGRDMCGMQWQIEMEIDATSGYVRTVKKPGRKGFTRPLLYILCF